MQNPDFSVIDMKTNEKFYLYKREDKYYLNRNGVDRYLNTLEQDLCAGLIVFTANGTKYMVVQRHTLPPIQNIKLKQTSNDTQLIPMWVVVHGNPLHCIQVSEDGRGGAYVVYGEEEDYIYFNEFARNLPVSHLIHIKELNIEFIVVENKLWIDPLKENKMTEEHKGLPVLGYLPQSPEKVALANTNKELEERCLRRIDWFEKENENAYTAFLDSLNNDVSTPLPTFKPPYDPKFLENARTELLSSFMWFNRAIFRPSRVSLPEDAKDTEAWTHGDGDVS